jgi:hypothetical protein
MIQQFKRSDELPENQIMQFNISIIASGIYIYKIRTGIYERSDKFIKW